MQLDMPPNWKELTTSVNEIQIQKFDGVRLMQNYPNPFNATTVISYSLPAAGYVEISIYNLLGQNIRTLRPQYQSIGTHYVTWDARDDFGNNLASGVFFYRIKTNNFTHTRKLLLLR